MPPKFELKRRALTTAIQAAETLMAAITTAFAGVPVVTKDVLSIWTDQLAGKMLRVTKASDLAMDLAKSDLEVDEVSNAIDAIEDRAASTRAAIMTYTTQNYPVQPIVPQNLPLQLNQAIIPTINNSIKRKPLEVPKFDGRRPEDWSGFWKTFSVQYGDDTQLDNINKLLHLRTYLHGDALNDIKALEITIPNYLVAVDRLKKKYGDKILLENRFINNLSVLPAVKDEKDHAGLQHLHRHVEINIENLSNIDVRLEEYQRTLFPTLATAIPRTLMREYDRENAAERSVPRLMNWLHEFVTKEAQYEMMANQSRPTESQPKLNAVPDSSNFKKEKKRFDKRDKRVYESSASMMSVAVRTCQFCESKSHDRKVCPLNAEERMEKLKAKNVCFRCLGRTPHPTNECRTSMKCYRCEGQHHTYLCTKPKSTATNESSSGRQIEVTEIKQNTVVNVNRPAVEFLMIQMAQLSGEKLQTKGVCYIDGGAQRTFIRADVAQKLNLKKLGTEKINLATFGQHPKMEVRNRVQVKIRPANGASPAILIDAIETPRCTTTPTEIPTSALNDKLKDLGIQVNCKQAALHSSEVDILLGVDHYNKITTGCSKFIEENLAAVHTILGWTLHGQTTQGTQLTASPTQANTITIIPSTDDLLRKFWELESIGVQHESMAATRDEKIIKKFNQTINWTGSHYSVQLPWTVNPDELADNYEIAKEVPSNCNLMNDDETKVLGLRLSPNTDQISLAVEITDDVETKRITKREVIHIIAQIFDPLGFASLFTITAKIFFQTLWLRNLTWNKELNEEIQETWKKWANQIPKLKEVKLPRWIGFKLRQENEFHIFCEASPRAVAYMRRKKEDLIIINFSFSKSRVAPVKQLTLPKMELMGALLAVRLKDQLKEVTDCDRYHYGTDSQMHWITNTSKRPPTFINNRAIEIREKSHVKAWKHVAGPENPADRLTRGINASELINDNLWWKGTKWLSEEQENWPNNKIKLPIDPDELDSEADEEEAPSGETHANAVQQNNQKIAFPISSSYLRTCRVWAWCYRFAHNSKQRADSEHRRQGVLNAEELVNAKQKLIIAAQQQHYAAEMRQLTEGKPLMAGSKLKLLNPFIDANGVMRLRTRLQNSKDEQTATQPIVLPQKCELTKLIFLHSHSQVLHCGLAATLAQFRESYWTPAARRTLKSTSSRCVTCMKIQGKLMQESPGLLPFDRITRCEPFAVTGVDFAGPMYIRGRKTKAYIALFTCGNIRAAHFELVPSLNTPDFIDAFERFVSRRGLPKTLYSDNGTTFHCTNKELAALLNNTKDESFKNYLCNKGVN